MIKLNKNLYGILIPLKAFDIKIQKDNQCITYHLDDKYEIDGIWLNNEFKTNNFKLNIIGTMSIYSTIDFEYSKYLKDSQNNYYFNYKLNDYSCLTQEESFLSLLVSCNIKLSDFNKIVFIEKLIENGCPFDEILN